jgi:hypothetical protein
MKKKINVFLIIYVAIGFCLLSFLGYKVYNDFIKKELPKEEEKYKEIDSYGYTLRDSDTNTYKTYYNELKDILDSKEIDYEKYAEGLSKIFITDLYTLNNKLVSTDVGGTEFIYPSQIDNFKLNATDTLYKYIESNFDGKRDQELPEVNNVIVLDMQESNYKIDKNTYDSYEIKVSIEYVKDLGYDKVKELILIKDNNKLYIVKGD